MGLIFVKYSFVLVHSWNLKLRTKRNIFKMGVFRASVGLEALAEIVAVVDVVVQFIVLVITCVVVVRY